MWIKNKDSNIQRLFIVQLRRILEHLIKVAFIKVVLEVWL